MNKDGDIRRGVNLLLYMHNDQHSLWGSVFFFFIGTASKKYCPNIFPRCFCTKKFIHFLQQIYLELINFTSMLYLWLSCSMFVSSCNCSRLTFCCWTCWLRDLTCSWSERFLCWSSPIGETISCQIHLSFLISWS